MRISLHRYLLSIANNCVVLSIKNVYFVFAGEVDREADAEASGSKVHGHLLQTQPHPHCQEV